MVAWVHVGYHDSGVKKSCTCVTSQDYRIGRPLRLTVVCGVRGERRCLWVKNYIKRHMSPYIQAQTYNEEIPLVL